MSRIEPAATERFARGLALSGAALTLAAALGLVGLQRVGEPRERCPAAPVAVVRVTATPFGAVAAVAASCTVAALVLLLWLGRRHDSPIWRPCTADVTSRRRDPSALIPERRAFSISYHAGGLYGP